VGPWILERLDLQLSEDMFEASRIIALQKVYDAAALAQGITASAAVSGARRWRSLVRSDA
jgi:hypothetical protein